LPTDWPARLPVLFLSGHGDIPMAVGAMARGAFNFVEKPYANDALVQLIQRALDLEVGLA
jgi:FixJ family two-component response regulator